MKETKINHEWSILCSKSIIDKELNNLSLVNLIEQLSFDVEMKDGQVWNEKEGDIFPLEMVIVTRLRKISEPDVTSSGRVGIDLVDPDNNILSSFEQDFELGEGIENIRMRFGIAGLKLTKSGLYHFAVSTKEEGDDKYKKVYSLPLKVNLNIRPHSSN